LELCHGLPLADAGRTTGDGASVAHAGDPA